MRSIFTVILLVIAFALHSQIMYVTPGGSGLKNGSSWANALDGNTPSGNGYTKLAQATQTATAGKQFWISEGTYKAATDNSRGRSFLIKEGVSFFGGFSGIENSIQERSIQQHKTIISGDIGVLNDLSDNAFHLFETDQTSSVFTLIPVIDGISMYGGNANNSSGSFQNTGGAVYLAWNKDAIIRNCIISNNNGLRGAAIYSMNKITLINCIGVNNMQAVVSGGVSTLTNCTIVNNEKGFQVGDNSQVTNCIFWGNGTVAYQSSTNIFVLNCCIQGGLFGGLNADPLFVNPTAGVGLTLNGLNADWNLLPASPCINAGENTGIPYNTFEDCANYKRIINNTVDFGAFEYNSTVYQPIIYRLPCTNPSVSLQTDTTARISWSRGNGLLCKVWIARAGQTASWPKTNGKDFVASSYFRAGDFVIENGVAWFCVYNGTGNQVNLSGLVPGTTYSACIFEHFSDSLAHLPATITFSTNGTIISGVQIYYVRNGGGVNGHDGRSWETAFSSPRPAISLSKSADAIWIATGTYLPSNSNNRYESFQLKEGIRIFGGFAGNETLLTQRISNANETILSGNIGNFTDSLDNSYHVVSSSPASTPWADTSLVDRITIRGGTADGPGENICGGGIFLNTNCVLKMTSCKVTSNACIGSGNPNNNNYFGGGGLMNRGTMVLDDCDFFSNKAVYLGGGLFNGSNLVMKNCQVHHNKITFPGGGWFSEWGGGGIYNGPNGRLTAESCEIKYNTTQNNLHGGGMFNRGKVQLKNSLVENNFSARDGGGVYSLGPIKILNSHFKLNQTAYTGGGIYAADSLRIDSSLFDYNAAHNSPSIYTSGYGIISNSNICSSNSTGQAGAAGGIRSQGKTHVENCEIHSHNLHGIQMINSGGFFNIVIIFTGSDGGGILHDGIDTLWVNNCSIHNNIAGGGGGVAVYNGQAYITNSKIVDNFCAKGAAVFNKAKAKISNCLIANNSYYNGGLFLNVGNSVTLMNNSTMSNNNRLTTDNGNALLVHGDYGNPTPNQFKLANCIIQSQTGLTGNYPGASGTDTIVYSCVTGGFSGTGNINASPMFINPTSGVDTTFNALLANWTLSACSPCINTGADSLCADTTDLAGDPRKYQRIDMGAYELKYDSSILAIHHGNTGRTTTTLHWKSAIKPCYTIVFLKDTVAGSPVPVPGINYTPGAVYGSGSNLNGWYCIYQGLDTAVSVTNLVAGTTYRVAVFNYILNSHYDVPGLMNFNTEKTTLADITKTYGNIPFTVQATSFSGITAHTYTISPAAVAGVSYDTVSISNAGTATIKARHGGNTMYLPDSTQALLTVNKAPLDAIADNKTKIYGEINPPLTISYSGFVLNENSSVIDTLPYAVTNATILSNVGTYVITATGGADNNYAINRVNGMLVINKLIIQVTSNPSICNGDTLAVGNSIYTAAGTYIDTLYSANIDTIVTTNLTVNPVFAFIENHGICNGATYNWHGNSYTTAGTYTANYTTIHGCDSIYTLNLAVNPVYAFTENHSICSGETYTWQGTDYTTAGTYSAGYTTMYGCDSVYTLNLTVNPVYAFTENHSICNGETYNWQGTGYTTSGTYTAGYPTISGCDSVYTLYLTVNTVPTGVTVTGITITADSTADAYQWIDCGNGFIPVNGAVYQSFTATVNGDYAVIITRGLCSDTSVCVPVTTVGIEPASRIKTIRIYPNPVSAALTIELTGYENHTSFEIFNSIGQPVSGGVVTEKAVVQTFGFAPGVYVVRLKNGDAVDFRKFVKE